MQFINALPPLFVFATLYAGCATVGFLLYGVDLFLYEFGEFMPDSLRVSWARCSHCIHRLLSVRCTLASSSSLWMVVAIRCSSSHNSLISSCLSSYLRRSSSVNVSLSAVSACSFTRSASSRRSCSGSRYITHAPGRTAQVEMVEIWRRLVGRQIASADLCGSVTTIS